MFTIKYEKEGYITVEKRYEIKLDINTDIAKIIQINPIYFDLAKWNIRKDAAFELDSSMEIELGSHTDCRSSASYNALSPLQNTSYL